MRIRIPFCRATVKALPAAWRRAVRRGERRVGARTTALLLRADQHPVATVAERVGVGKATGYGWLHAFLAERWARLVYHTAPGRPVQLTPTQTRRRHALVSAGPAAAG